MAMMQRHLPLPCLGVLFVWIAFPAGCAMRIEPRLLTEVQALSASQRDRVRLYFLNSPIDPLHLGRLPQLRDAITAAGFTHSRYVAVADGARLARAVRRVHQEDPAARIVLIAWSGASLAAWDAAADLAENGITVDRIAYLDSNWIKTRIRKRGHPANVGRVILVYRRNNPPPGGVTDAVLHVIPTSDHLGVPAHARTAEALIEELIELASSSP